MARASNSIGKAALAAILKGLEGVTQGPWVRSGIQQKRLDQHGPFLAAGPDNALMFFSPIGRTHNDQAVCIRDLDHIARCDPYTMRKIGEYVATLESENALLRGLLWYGWHEMNAIRAESGVPRSYDGTSKSISEKYWSYVVDAMSSALGDDAKPWPSEYAKAALRP